MFGHRLRMLFFGTQKLVKLIGSTKFTWTNGHFFYYQLRSLAILRNLKHLIIMPVEFLSHDQLQRYGQYNEVPSEEQLARHFYLDHTDKQLIQTRRLAHNQLGFAVQLGTVRFLGTFLSDLSTVPQEVIHYLAAQLGIEDPSCFTQYAKRAATRKEHAQAIQQHYHYQTFGEGVEHLSLLRWLFSRALLGSDRPSVLFDLTTARLVENKILLPGASMLARLVSRVRERVAQFIYKTLASMPNENQRNALEKLLIVPKDGHLSPLETLGKSPTRVSSPALGKALERIEQIRQLGVSKIDTSFISPSQLKLLARHAKNTWASKIARMPDNRRMATLLAFAQNIESLALDDALEVFDLLLKEFSHHATKTAKTERLDHLRAFDKAAQQLKLACQMMLDESYEDQALRGIIFNTISRDKLLKAVDIVDTTNQNEHDSYCIHLSRKWRSIRRFLPQFCRTIDFSATTAGLHIQKAWEFLSKLEMDNPTVSMENAPLDFIPDKWKNMVLQDDLPLRQYFSLCLLEQTLESLKRRDIYLDKSTKWGNPRKDLLPEQQWKSIKPQITRSLNRSLLAKEELDALQIQLDQAYQQTTEGFEDNQALRLEQRKGRQRIVLTPLDKLEEPESLIQLRERVNAYLPKVDLPEILLEVQAWTGFANAFAPLTGTNTRMHDFSTSVCATLMAEACNIGWRPLQKPGNKAFSSARLSWIQQNYIRTETLTEANARLVDYQKTLDLAQAWGGGEVASVDGMRFVVPVRTINARPNSKYFPAARGVTYYNYTSDQFTGFHSIVIPGTLRDSLYILAGLLENQTSLAPQELISDTAGYSDVVFGLFWLLGYQFSPRIADIGAMRLWKLDPDKNYGKLNQMAKHRIKTQLIIDNWDEILRVVASLKMGTVDPIQLMRIFQHPRSTLAKAIAELGKLPKTLYLLRYISDEAYRRRILTQINRGEGRHSLARAVFHGKKGLLRKRYREGQEDQLGALGLVVNAIVLWNTRYMQAALEQIKRDGYNPLKEDIARLSPLGYEHINFLGRYHFEIEQQLKNGILRPLQDPKIIDQLL